MLVHLVGTIDDIRVKMIGGMIFHDVADVCNLDILLVPLFQVFKKTSRMQKKKGGNHSSVANSVAQDRKFHKLFWVKNSFIVLALNFSTSFREGASSQWQNMQVRRNSA